MTMMPAEPSIDPGLGTSSKEAGMSSWSGSSIGTDEPPGMTALSLLAVADAAGELRVVDQLAQRRLHRRFEDARLLHVAADAVQLRAAVLLGAERREPLGAVRCMIAGRLHSVSTLLTAVGLL